MAEDKYIKPLIVSVKQAQKIYPNAKFYIYDCGLSETNKSKLKKVASNIRIKRTCVQIFPVRLVYTKRRLMKRGMQLIVDAIIRIFYKKYGNPHIDLIFQQQEFEMKIRNKLAIVQNHSLEVKAPFIFIDADAFLVQPIDELIKQEFDIGLTLRNGTLNYNYNYCRLLNVGVMFFFGSTEKNNHFIKHWVKWADINKEAYTEQTSLSRMLLSYQADIFTNKNQTHSLCIDGEKIHVRILDSLEYNNTNVKMYPQENNNKTKIVHFKNGRFNQPIFDEVIDKINNI